MENKVICKVAPEEVTRVKALGFLWDKNTADCFNGRVITRNGKITAKECSVIAEAAEKFGNGHVTMTSRMAMEIQGVSFDNIEVKIKRDYKDNDIKDATGTEEIKIDGKIIIKENDKMPSPMKDYNNISDITEKQLKNLL